MTKIMPVPRHLILLSYQQRPFALPFHAFRGVPDCLLYETARHYWRNKMKRSKIDPDTSAIIKMGLIDYAFEVIKDMLLFALGAAAILSLVCESEEEN